MILSKKSFYIIAFSVMLIDQITKYWIFFNLPSCVNITPFLNLIFVKNFGVSFGIFNFGEPILFSRIILSLLVFGVIIYIISFQKKILPFALIVGGAMGNLIDRILLGYVIDFIDVFVGVYHWPVFNIADTSVCIGVGIYFIKTFKQEYKG